MFVAFHFDAPDPKNSVQLSAVHSKALSILWVGFKMSLKLNGAKVWAVPTAPAAAAALT